MEKITSQKGGELLLIDGYRYRKARTNHDNSISWRCVKTTCQGRLRELDISRILITEHNHAIDVSGNEVAKVSYLMRTRAMESCEKPRRIIQQATSGISLEGAINLPTYEASQRLIERTRKRVQHSYQNPSRIEDLIIPQGLQVTVRNREFLLWDSGCDDTHRIIMFGTEENLGTLVRHPHWFIDGTFKVAPTLFFQLFTIHALVDRSARPLIYVLLRDKTQETYLRMLQKLLECKPTLNPISVMADFEKASQNAVAEVFNETEIIGCLFHLGQCLWRKIQEFSMVEAYRDSPDLRSKVKMLLALSFVPIADVSEAFETLIDSAPAEMQDIIEYWEDNYVGRRRRDLRSQPRFPIRLWNVYNRIINDLPRTNNSVEAWHRAFQQTIDCYHPSVYRLIEQLRNEQDRVEIEIARFQAGFRQPQASKAKYVRLNMRLSAMVQTYERTDILDYLRRVAQNIAI